MSLNVNYISSDNYFKYELLFQPTSNYAFVPDGLTLFGSTKTSPPVMR